MHSLYKLITEIISESVTPNDIADAIKNKIQVIITYDDGESNAKGKRLIEPYVYGLSKAGNDVLRAYQYEGDTKRGRPKWKLFRIDRITSWQPTSIHFTNEPNARGWNAQSFNTNGDNGMSTIFNIVSFENNNITNNTTQNLSAKKALSKYGPKPQAQTIKKGTTNVRGPIINNSNSDVNALKNDLDKILQI